MKTTDKEFFRVVNYIRINFGVNLIHKRALIEKRLMDVLSDNNFKSFDELMNSVEKDKSNKFIDILIGALVTNHTYFMREAIHFKLLEEVVFPKLLNNNSEIRIWSAAASSGQEAYSIEMLLKDFLEDEKKTCSIEVVGTDISDAMLQIALAGEYTKEQVDSVSDSWKNKFFTKKINGDYKVNNCIKEDVTFKKLNLMSPFEFEKKFHIIFLRNVLSYFDSGIVNQVVEKVVNNLEVGGYLFIGSTESIDIKSDKLAHLQPSLYRRINHLEINKNMITL